MQNALQISHWLRDGVAALSPADRNKLRLLLSRYPSFLPLKALAAAAEEAEAARSEALYFSGLNPVLLQALKDRKPVAAADSGVEEEADTPALPAENAGEIPGEEEILVHLPASEDTGEVNLPEAEVPMLAATQSEAESETEAATELPPAETAPLELQQPSEEETTETTVEVIPEAVLEAPASVDSNAEDKAGVLLHLPASEDTEVINIPEVEDVAETPEATETPTIAAVLPAEDLSEEASAATLKDFDAGASEKGTAAASLSQALTSSVSAPDSTFNAENSLPIGEESEAAKEEEVIQPLYANDYFLHQGVSNGEDTIPKSGAFQKQKGGSSDLMIMRSFAEWLRFFQLLKTEASDEEAARRAVKASWQKERLAAALEEEEEEIPEVVFEMALTSIAQEGNMASEPLALIYAKQGKWEKAIEVYQRLQLRNPQKSAYFAEKIAVLEQQHRS